MGDRPNTREYPRKRDPRWNNDSRKARQEPVEPENENQGTYDRSDDRSRRSRGPSAETQEQETSGRRSSVDEDKKKSGQAPSKRPRYNTTTPAEVRDRPPPNFRTYTSRFAICDGAIQSIKAAKKKNEIRIGVLVRSRAWPHGRLVCYIVNLYAKIIEEKFFDMLIEHMVAEKKGPISPLDAVKIPTQASNQVVDLQKLLENSSVKLS